MIAILGWGSLIWDPQELELADSAWHVDGPSLPIEFARVSGPDPNTRLQRLTLVLHEGVQKVHTLWARSASNDFRQACENLGDVAGRGVKTGVRFHGDYAVCSSSSACTTSSGVGSNNLCIDS